MRPLAKNSEIDLRCYPGAKRSAREVSTHGAALPSFTGRWRSRNYALDQIRALRAYLRSLPQRVMRMIELRVAERSAIKTHSNIVLRPAGAKPRLFNLDLHIGVIADLVPELEHQGARLTRWSISEHNHLVPGFRPVPDPVAHINANTWRGLDQALADAFCNRYDSFLRTFDGFIATHSPAFAQVLARYMKPTLIVCSTRYEIPFTGQPDAWSSLDDFLVRGVEAGRLLVTANNVGDADYMAFFNGYRPPVVPSLCDKPGKMWSGRMGRRVVLGRDVGLVASICEASRGNYEPVSVLGRPYTDEGLLACGEALILPQNVSTMTLFEMATAAMPVAVPSREWLKLLEKESSSVLGELTFAQIEELSTEGLSAANPCNYESPEYIDWWLDRADFFLPDLMPNVRVVESIDQLVSEPSQAERLGNAYGPLIRRRNAAVREKRRSLITSYLDMF